MKASATRHRCAPVSHTNQHGKTLHTRDSVRGKDKSRKLNAVVSFQDKCHVPLSIQGQQFRALIDTGSTISAVNDSVIRNLQIPYKNLSNSDITFITGAGGSNHPVKGKITLPIVIGNLKIQHTFYVIQDLCTSILLGTNFLIQQKAHLDWPSRKLYLQEFLTHTNVIKIKQGLARTRSFVNIKCHTMVNVPVRLSHTVSNQTVLLEPIPQQSGLAIAKVLVINKPGHVFIQVTNTSDNDIALPSGKILASVKHVHDNEVFPLEVPNSEKSPRYKDISLDLSNSILTDPQKKIFREFINQNGDVFARNLSELGKCKLFHHSIQTSNEIPIRSQPYRTSPKAKQEIQKQISEMLKHNIIENSNSSYGSPIVLVKKPNNEYRFAIDYRKLNAVTPIQTFPAVKLEDVFDAIGENKAKIFSTLDLASGYWQIALDEKTKHKTAFITHDNLYQFKRLPFGLVNAPATFQMIMNLILKGLTWKHCLVYIDDIIVWSDNFENHLQHLDLIFQRLREANLTLKPTKCVFAKSEVTYLGHIISHDGIKVDPSKIQAVQSFPLPRNQHDIRSFLGLANYYRKFVKGFSKIALPLNRLLTKDVPFKWTNDCQRAFDELKQALTTTPVLAYPDFNKPFILSSDASNMAIGYVLSQIGDDGKEHVIAYGGRALNSAEKAYSVTEQEMLALISAVTHFRVYLLNNQFTVYTDHKALTWLTTIKHTNNRLIRWVFRLQEYSFDVKHRPGTKHQNSDALSRRQYPETSDSPQDFEICEVTFFYENENHIMQIHENGVAAESHSQFDNSNQNTIVEEQKNCPYFQQMYLYLKNGELPEKSKRK